ncbi:MAG: hypothetical protein H7338_01135 [Candidatus Sericytochromatia bacterium]|nr:hypothetical protein [Candidatus Sericytochromatia bacterium]
MPDGLKPLDRTPRPSAQAPIKPTTFIHSLSVPQSGDDPLRAKSLAKDTLKMRPATGTVVAVASSIRDGLSLPVPVQEQTGNACGTTSLSMVLTYFKAAPQIADVKHIDAAIRPTSKDNKIDSFTAPIDLVLYAQRKGFGATLRNEATTADLDRSLAQGVPPIILYDWDAPKGDGLHYVVVSGSRQQDGKKEWKLTDPSGHAWFIDEAEMLRRWTNLHVAGVPIPYSRVMIAVAPIKGMVSTAVGTLKPAADIKLPPYNGSLVVDLGGSVATWGIGVGAKAYDASKWVAGTTRAGVTKLQSGWKAATSAVSGRSR